MRPFGCPMTILNTLDPLGNFDGKDDERFFVGYSINSKAFRVFNTRTRKVKENLHITFLENKPSVAGSGLDWLFDIDLLTNSMNYEPVTTGNQTNKNAVVDDAGKKTNKEPANEGERNGQEKEGGASNKEGDQNVQEFRAELDNLLVQQKQGYATNKTQEGKHAIGTKWVYRNKKDERGILVRNKGRLVAQGYSQKEGIDYDEMDVKSAFLYGTIEEEVAWYETLSTYLLENGFRRGIIDKTLFIKKDKGDILLVQVYVDHIIFGSTKKSLCTEFESLMHKKFQMSSIGELTFFLGLQVMQRDDGIFISQDKYVADILKKFDFSLVKTASTPIETNKALYKDEEAEDVDIYLYRSMIASLMYLIAYRLDIIFVVCACARFQVTPKVSHLYAMKRIFRYLNGQPKLGLWYPRDSPFDLEAFLDSDYAGASLDRKSTTGGSGPRCQVTILGGAEAQTRFKAASKQFNDPPLLRVNTLRSGEDSMKLKELIELCTVLQAREKCSEEDLLMKLLELVNQRKKFFAQQRAKAKRNKPMNPAQQKEYMSNYIKNQEGGHSIKKLKSLSFEQVKEIFETTMRKVQSFVPIGSELEVQKLKRAGQEVLEEPVKRQKIGEASGSGQGSAKKEKKLLEEELQKLLVIVPVEEVYVEALKVKYLIIDWEVYSKDTRRYWKIIKVGNHTEAYQIFVEMLKKFDRDDLVKLWDLVKERFSTTEPTSDKEKELWVELKRLFDPNNDDTLWKLQRYMHNSLVWRLYDTCGVHHVSSVRGHEIFMVDEKEYPLTRGLMTVMLANKLQVDQYSEMGN
ncbi:retrovirus-related pol polyprotein from transposon TNT 1-94 [Tanacetum coccineum]